MSFICKAPWTSIAFQPNGVAPCCSFKLQYVEKFKNDDTLFQDIRDSFLNGVVPPGCIECTERAALGQIPYFTAFDQYKTDFKTIDIQEINLRSNNFCNLSCRMCGPHFSSKWEEEFKGAIVITRDTDVFNKIKQLDLKKLKTIVFAGGEPTITPEHVALLKELLQIGHTNPIIRVATNLQTLKNKDTNLIELWKQFPNLYLNVSVDAVGDRAVDIRSGTNWDSLTANIEALKQHNIKFNVVLTVSALNIWYLEDTLDYLSTNCPGVDIRISMLFGPDILNLWTIPQKYRTQVDQILDACLQKNYRVEHVKTHLHSNDTSHLWSAFLIYNLLLDQTRNESFCKNLPFFDDIVLEYLKLS